MEKTTCIKCKAINEGRPLYAVTFLDEEGMSDQLVFNTPREQLDYLEEAFDNGALQCTLQIISNEELKDWDKPQAIDDSFAAHCEGYC